MISERKETDLFRWASHKEQVSNIILPFILGFVQAGKYQIQSILWDCKLFFLFVLF